MTPTFLCAFDDSCPNEVDDEAGQVLCDQHVRADQPQQADLAPSAA